MTMNAELIEEYKYFKKIHLFKRLAQHRILNDVMHK